MCRNFKTLFNFEPPASEDEVRAASLQFVRKLSGFNKPSKANAAAFERAVEDVAAIANDLLASLTTAAPPRNREIEAARARGVNVTAAQHVYTVSQSSFVAHALPRWVAVGGRDSLLARLANPDLTERLNAEILEVLEMRGGAEKIVLTEAPEALDGRSLADLASDEAPDVASVEAGDHPLDDGGLPDTGQPLQQQAVNV